jgi:transcriptional regulator with XRE-family HTH domain
MEPPETAAAVNRYASRPPILLATTLLGLTDAEVARRLGVHPPQVNMWALGKKPIPKFRHVAMQLIVTDLIFAWYRIGAATEDEVVKRRRKLVHDCVLSAFRLSNEELGPVPPLVVDAALVVLNRDNPEQRAFTERVHGLAPGEFSELIEKLERDEGLA